MYSQFLEDTQQDWKRIKINLSAKGRDEFRKSVAHNLIVLSVVLFALIGVMIMAQNLSTTETNYSNHLIDVRVQNTHNLSIALSKLK